jgi:regulator of replication initiation timing
MKNSKCKNCGHPEVWHMKVGCICEIREDVYCTCKKFKPLEDAREETPSDTLKDEEILKNLYDLGMIDFEGDDENLIMQVPTNIVKTGKFVVDVYREGFRLACKHQGGARQKDEEFLEFLNLIKDYNCNWLRTEIGNKIKKLKKSIEGEKRE